MSFLVFLTTLNLFMIVSNFFQNLLGRSRANKKEARLVLLTMENMIAFRYSRSFLVACHFASYNTTELGAVDFKYIDQVLVQLTNKKIRKHNNIKYIKPKSP